MIRRTPHRGRGSPQHFLIMNISVTHQDIDNGKRLIKYNLSHVPQKMVNFGPLTAELTELMFAHSNSTFSEDHISPQLVLPPQIFTHVRQWQ